MLDGKKQNGCKMRKKTWRRKRNRVRRTLFDVFS
jgi:hypothetical protein